MPANKNDTKEYQLPLDLWSYSKVLSYFPTLYSITILHKILLNLNKMVIFNVLFKSNIESKFFFDY